MRTQVPKVSSPGNGRIREWRCRVGLLFIVESQQLVYFTNVKSGETQIEIRFLILLQFERKQFLIPIGPISSLRAAFNLKCPSTTSPSLRTRHGILQPNSRIEPHMRSTAESFLRGLRAIFVEPGDWPDFDLLGRRARSS